MSHQYSKLKFRSDINGLRAWACLAVVFFHFQILNFQGGFVGVDVFFVISGYLMTAILYPKLLHQQLNILQFYTQRLKRVFPVLFAMLLILLAIGSFKLYGHDFYDLVHEAKVALTFYYNIRFKDTDYFSETTTDWLTHTWTLGLEFQFYLLFPIVLLMIYKFTKRIKHHITILALISLCSLIAMQYQVHLKPNHAFFLLQYRGWEFLAGAILFLVQYKQPKILKKHHANFILSIGWLALIASFLLMNDGGHYPDYRTLMPVLATLAILYPIQDTILTQNPITQYLGQASYSIYLWHWCIYVWIGLYGYHENTMALYGFALFSIVIGCISYVMLEKGATKLLNNIPSYKKQFAILLCMLIISSITLNQFRKEGSVFWVEKNNEKMADIIAFKDDKSQRAIDCLENKTKDCVFGNKQANVGLILVGDSHAAALVPILDTLAKQYDVAIATFIAGGCPVAFNLQVMQGHDSEEAGLFCLETLAKLKIYLNQHPNAKVLIANRNNYYLLGANEDRGKNKLLTRYHYQEPIDIEDIQSIQQWQQNFSDDLFHSACQIAKTHKTYWLKPTPEIGVDVPKTLAGNIFYRNDDSDIKIPVHTYQQRQYLIDPIQQRAERECGVKIVDINGAFCDKEYCYGSSGRKSYYYDDDHLSITGANLARPYLAFLFQTLSSQ